MLKLKRIEQGLLFLVLLFLPTQLGKHFWPDFSFIYSLPVDYLSPTIYFWDLLVALLLAVFILQRKPVKELALNLFLVFFLSQVFSLVPQFLFGQSLNLGAGLVRAEQYLIAGLFGVYIASSNFKQIRSIVFWALGLAILGESILAILQFIKGGTLGLWILGERTFSVSTPGIATFDFYGSQFLRPYGTFSHPNVLSAFLLLATLILFLKNFLIKKMIGNIVLSFSIVAITITLSRVAIVSGVLSAMLLLNKKGRIIFVIAALLILPILYTRFSAILDFDNLSLIRREQLSQAALSMWSYSKYFGVGLNNFIPTSADQVIVGPSRFLQPVHNIFLLTLSETGIFGLAGFLLLVGFPIFRLVVGFKNHHSFQQFVLMWVVIFFLGFFDHYFLTLPQGYRMLFLVWGLSLSFEE